MNFKKTKTFIIAVVLSFSLSISAYAVMPDSLVPVGDVVGISLDSEGVVISQLSEFSVSGEIMSPAGDAGLRPGDIIVSVDGVDVKNSTELLSSLENIGNRSVQIGYVRNGEEHFATVNPYFENDKALLGIWISDGIAGIGTITFFDTSTGFFGALGHPISSGEQKELSTYNQGNIYRAEISQITTGKSGTPGLINGSFSKTNPIGTITDNTQVGIFGYIDDAKNINITAALPTAEKEAIETGPAKIISSVSGESKEYSIEITRVYNDYNDGRSMMIEITDPELISLTGGIVQGMSGSPIIQNGKLIGAVTHVLVNDPTRGYGISIEDMLAVTE